MNLGNGGLNGILLDRLESSFGVVASAAAGLLDIGSSTEGLALGSIGLGSHACQLLFYHAKLMQELAKGFTFCSVSSGQTKRRTCATCSTCTQLQTSNVEDIESNLVAFVDLAQQVFYRYFGILKVDLAGRGAFDAHLALFCTG